MAKKQDIICDTSVPEMLLDINNLQETIEAQLEKKRKAQDNDPITFRYDRKKLEALKQLARKRSVEQEKDITYIADVFETEPKVRKSLVKSPNFIGTPHIASMTKEANFEMVKTAVNNFLEGRPVNL